jgi:hypothetical protein
MGFSHFPVAYAGTFCREVLNSEYRPNESAAEIIFANISFTAYAPCIHSCRAAIHLFRRVFHFFLQKYVKRLSCIASRLNFDSSSGIQQYSRIFERIICINNDHQLQLVNGLFTRAA